jgi:predicted ABC-type transport system involved in lysophospholipase L1 biosynthesis ATPase subunit
MKPDKETAEHVRRNHELRRMTESEGWGIAKAMLLERIALLDSVSSIPQNISFEEMGKQAMFRAHAISLMQDWLNEIEGRLDQTNQQDAVLMTLREESIVRQYTK